MAIRDPFSYSARWDSAGLSCADCVHFSGPSKWPDIEKISHCKLHKISLAIEIADDGRMEGEWFCKDFKDNGTGRTSPTAQKEFDSIKDQLESKKLYGAYGNNGNLKEHDFNEFKPVIQS